MFGWEIKRLLDSIPRLWPIGRQMLLLNIMSCFPKCLHVWTRDMCAMRIYKCSFMCKNCCCIFWFKYWTYIMHILTSRESFNEGAESQHKQQYCKLLLFWNINIPYSYCLCEIRLEEKKFLAELNVKSNFMKHFCSRSWRVCETEESPIDQNPTHKSRLIGKKNISFMEWAGIETEQSSNKKTGN